MGKKYDFIPNRLNKYSIRRFTVGTASILIGSLLFLGQDVEASEQIESAKTDEENNLEVTTNADQETLETTPDSTEETQKDIVNDSVDNFEETSKQETEENDQSLTEQSTPEEQKFETEEVETSEDSVEAEQVEEQPQKETSEKSNENNTPEQQPLETEENQNPEVKVEDDQTKEQPQRETPKEPVEEKQNENSQQESDETQESPQEELEALPKKEVSKDKSLEEQEEIVKSKEDVKVALYNNDKDEREKSAAPQEFIDKYNATTNRKEMVETMLSEIYESEDVEGIMNNLDVDYNTISANDLYNSVIYAGLEYASQQKNAFTSFAVRENPNQIYDSLEQIGEQFNLKKIDPNTGVTINGEGSTALNQYPAYYTVEAVPNHSTNNMDFTVKWKVDKNATESAHRAVVGGLNFGSAYKVPSVIKGQSTITGTKNPIVSNHNMSIGGKPGYPPGYASNTFIEITKFPVKNDGHIEYRFSVPVTDWNGDLGFYGNIGMYSQDVAGTAVRPDTFDNYFRDQHYIKVSSNPEKEFEFRDDISDVDEIPYQIEYRVSKDLPMGEQRTIREGKNGKRGTIYTIVSYDGEDVGKLIKETYNEAPTNKLVELGIGNLDSEDEAPKPPIVDPKLSGENTITGESVPNADIQINVGGKTYTTKSDDSGRFSTTLPDYTLKQGETITATATVDGKTSQPGKTIVPRDGRTPSIKTDVVRGKNDEGKDGSWITIRNSETNEEIDKFFVPDGAKGEKGDKGEDGESPEVEVIDNGDGTKTIFIKNPGEDEPQKAIIKDGKDGNSSVITQERGTKDGRTGVYVTVWETDSKGNQIDGTEKTEFIPDGKDGADGKDGQTYAPVVEKGEDGTTTIKFYPVDPKTGEPDTSQAPIATGEVKDGQDGKDGVDGEDGKDGQTYAPVVEKGEDGTTTIKFYPVDPKTGEPDTSQAPIATGEVKDGQDGKDGVDGEDGKDGQTYAPVVEKGEDGTTTIKFYPVDPKTG
ncbi:YSIRK-type signal peptide-containing protein, partial [Nosocomiicoccus ampullae]